jgi:DNA-binding response OmpR family regulator
MPFRVGSMAPPPVTGCTVLVVDDEATVREVVASYLDREGFRVTQASDGNHALELIEAEMPDLVVLDLMLPGVDGLSILSAIRSTMSTPVILLTARADETDRILGLEMGADDYVVKPFSPREVVARVKAVLKRTRTPFTPNDRLDYDDLIIDGATREVSLRGVPVDLTAREFDLLYFLASSPRQVFSRGQLLAQVWESSPEWQDPATVTVHIGRLRQKLETDSVAPRWITTIWGVGYRFEP